MSKYYANLNEQNRKQVILIAVIGFLALAAVSMFLLLRARTTTNNALLLATKSAKEASAAKSMFLSNMSHEIRTPLNAILGLSQIAKYSNNQSRALEVIGQIESAGNHLLALINDILDMSKIEASSFVISNVPFNVLKCIDNISEMIKIKANEKSLNFITSIDKKMPKYLIGDSLRLDQVLLNLLSNAIKFTPKDGTVSLTAKVIEDDDKSVLISFEVLDTGIGIIQENIQKIFLPFEQADGSITKSFGGTGLGLSISKKLAELMNGEIIVDSEQGKGSIFTLTARFNKPLEEPIEEEFTPIKEFVSNNIITKILLVDDMPINRLIVRKMLEKEAVSIEEATDGLEAVNKFTASPVGYYDIILMDVHMPKMNGYEATRNIRAQERIDAEEVCIIAMTASAFSEDVALAKESGMNDHMSKPINMKMLISKIEVYRKKHYIG